MPIFTRRRLQAMLDDICPCLPSSKARDLLNRLENKRVDQALPAEMELALLWALSRLGELEIEPDWWPSGARPDAYAKSLVSGKPAIIEIAATNDNSMSAEGAMDSVALQIVNFANEARRGVGKYLYFRFAEETGWSDGTYFRRVLASLDYKLGERAKARIRDWLSSIGESTGRIAINDSGMKVEIEKTKYRQHRYHNIWSTNVPQAFSLRNNPLRSLLVRKLRQLKGADAGISRFIFLADVGSTLLRRLGQIGEIDPTRRTVSGHQILSNFVDEHAADIDAVVVFTPHRVDGPVPVRWRCLIFPRSGFEPPLSEFRQLVDLLPRPRFEGNQARSIFRQGAFDPKAKGWWEALTIHWDRETGMQVKFSARALMDLLAGRIQPDEFRRAIGEGGVTPNLFDGWLESGYIIQSMQIEHGGLDRDDDFVVLKLADDPSARELRLAISAPKPPREQ